MGLSRSATTAALLLAATLASPKPHAASSIEDLEQRIRVLERQLEIQQEEAAAKKATTPVITASDKGFSAKSPDAAYELKVRALVQFDGRTFHDDDPPANDTFLLRRIRPTFEGSLGKLVGFRLTPEFAGGNASIVDAYVDLRFHPAATLRAGKVKGPVGLERLQSGGALMFIERGFPTELAPNRDLGVQIQGLVLDQRLGYVVGLYNGAADGRDAAASDGDNRKEWAARVFAEPFKTQPGFLQGLGFGIAASSGSKEPTTAPPDTGTDFKPQYRTPGQSRFFKYDDTVVADGDHRRLSPQLYFYRNSFGLLAEYIESEQTFAEGAVDGDIENTAWQVAASYLLTGETASFNGVSPPNSPFALGGGGWGAFEIAARYGRLTIDRDAFDLGFASLASQASEATAWTLGLNWYLTANARISFNYSETSFDGGAVGGDRRDEKALLTRVQFTY